MKIVIPSHKRPDKVSSVNVVNNAIICVAEDQVDAYRIHNPNSEIVGHPSDMIGISKKRNWILDKFGDVFMMDDDIKRVRRCYLPDGEKRPHPNADEVTSLLHDTYHMVKDAGIQLWGFSKTGRSLHYPVNKPISMNGFIQGCALGVMKSENLRFPDLDSMTGEDEFIALINAHYNRKMWIDRRFYFEFNTSNTNVGGCEDIRNVDSSKQSYIYLKKNFGNAIKLDKVPEGYGKDFDYEISLKWRLKIPY